MIVSKYLDSIEIFDLIYKLESEDLSEEGKETLKKLEQKLLLFKCPSCDTPIGLAFNRDSWEKAYLSSWISSIKSELSNSRGK